MKNNNEKLMEQFECIVNSAHGIYSAQSFAQYLDFSKVTGISQESWNVLLAGPEHEDYIETWSDCLSDIVITDSENKRWLVYESEGIYLYPESINDLIEWDEMN